MQATIPASHLDLLQRPIHAVLTTIMPDGTPQSSLIWIDFDHEYLLVNTTLERQKGINMRACPKVTILIIDPVNSSRWLEVRGRVIQTTCEGAEAHANKLTRRYCRGKQFFYGDIYPVEQRSQETRVIVKIQPLKVSLDAIFK